MRNVGGAETGVFNLPIFDTVLNPATTDEEGQPIEGPPALSNAPALPAGRSLEWLGPRHHAHHGA